MRVPFMLGAAALAVLMVGCSDDGTVTEDAPGDGVVLRVVDGGSVARDWTLSVLEAEVEFVEIAVDGDPQRGPRLVDVIAASGVAGWETGEVLGMSEGRVVEVTLEIDAATVDENWVFDVTNRGTLKLAAPELPRQEWVRDVGEIRFP
jgi:hypothetical protein